MASLLFFLSVNACPYQRVSPSGLTHFSRMDLCFLCLVFAMPVCASVYMCLVVTCWERADPLALDCGVKL